MSREVPEASFESGAFGWLLRQKITIPDRVAGYIHRADLGERAMPTRRRLTVLKASGGFGKTTLLAETCRQLRGDGVATAYLSLDEYDTPDTLEAYVALACASAGLDVGDVTNVAGLTGGPTSRTEVVLRKIQSLRSPFVIAFDELERLPQPASVAVLELMLQRGPPNLHLAFACRRIPEGVNVTSVLLEGRAEILEAEDLRFSRAEVARFFDLGLSHRALTEEVDRSAGWPFALRIRQNSRDSLGEGKDGRVDGYVGNWIESRLFAQLGRDDRDIALDLGLFGWFDEGLLTEVLQRSDSFRRVESMESLEGLLERVGSGGAGSLRLHPLVRDHCARQRFKEDPERNDDIHRRIANALARRGEAVLAMRHAIRGGSPSLAGEILARAGGVRFWTRHGVAQYLEADRLLTEDVVAESPRLRLVRCVALMLSGRLREGREMFAGGSRSGRDAIADDADFELFADDCIVRGGMWLYGGVPIGSVFMRTLAGDMDWLVRSGRLDPVTRGHVEYALCVLHFNKGEFGPALGTLFAARKLLGSRYIDCHGELLHGQIDFVKGRLRDADAHYRRSRRIARKWLPSDSVAATGCEIALREAALERNGTSPGAAPPDVPHPLRSQGVPFGYFAMASNMLIDARLQSGRVVEALAVVDELLLHARGAGLTNLERLLAALRVTVLVIAGRIDDAERAWRHDALPEDPADCVDLGSQTWREMEAVAEARARLSIAVGRWAEARSLLRELRALAAERCLRRIEMRALALSIMLGLRSGRKEASVRHLEEYLGLYAECPNAGPLLRDGGTCAELVSRFVESHPDSPHAPTARSLLAAMRRAGSSRRPSLSEREMQVLRLLPDRTVGQVAASIGLSVHGVRYHLRKLFAKLGVSNRAELLSRARETGLITDGT